MPLTANVPSTKLAIAQTKKTVHAIASAPKSASNVLAHTNTRPSTAACGFLTAAPIHPAGSITAAVASAHFAAPGRRRS